jgi:hypothetical protein
VPVINKPYGLKELRAAICQSQAKLQGEQPGA